MSSILRGLLRDARLRRAAPAFRRLPHLLARECSAFVARAATSVRQVESSHPCECAEQLLALHCPGAAQLHLHFDARTQLPGGARLGVYLDAACTYELLTLEAEDAAAAETLCVPAGRAWLLLSSDAP